jgi:hypothetical protein
VIFIIESMVIMWDKRVNDHDEWSQEHAGGECQWNRDTHFVGVMETQYDKSSGDGY